MFGYLDLFLFVASGIINSLVLCSAYRKKWKTLPDYFIGNMCICGILYSVAVYLPHACLQLEGGMSQQMLQCIGQSFSEGVLCSVQNTTFLLYFIDRYMAIRKPLFYKVRIRLQYAYPALFSAWIFWIVLISCIVSRTDHREHWVCMLDIFTCPGYIVPCISVVLSATIYVNYGLTCRELVRFVHRRALITRGNIARHDWRSCIEIVDDSQRNEIVDEADVIENVASHHDLCARDEAAKSAEKVVKRKKAHLGVTDDIQMGDARDKDRCKTRNPKRITLSGIPTADVQQQRRPMMSCPLQDKLALDYVITKNIPLWMLKAIARQRKDEENRVFASRKRKIAAAPCQHPVLVNNEETEDADTIKSSRPMKFSNILPTLTSSFSATPIIPNDNLAEDDKVLDLDHKVSSDNKDKSQKSLNVYREFDSKRPRDQVLTLRDLISDVQFQRSRTHSELSINFSEARHFTRLLTLLVLLHIIIFVPELTVWLCLIFKESYRGRTVVVIVRMYSSAISHIVVPLVYGMSCRPYWRIIRRFMRMSR